MNKSTPSLLALLGLVAVAGYQNRGRISEMLADAKQKTAAPGSALSQQGGGFVAEMGQMFQSGQISTALGDLVERFKGAGRADAAQSWVSDKANMPLDVTELEAALGEETLTELAQKTGLTRAELLLRLNVALPDVVNRFTPNGRLPTEVEAQNLL